MGGHFTKGELESTSVLVAAEVLMGVVSSNCPEGVLTPKNFREVAGAGHEAPIDLSFIAGEEICLNVAQPVFEKVCLEVVENNCGEPIDVAINEAIGPIWFSLHSITKGEVRRDAMGWGGVGAGEDK